MRKLSFFAALVVAMGAVSCVQDINDGTPAGNDGAVTFEASFGVMSKAVLEPGATESKVSWEAGDQVSVLAGEANYLYTAAAAGYSTTLATEATGVPAEGTFYAVYPYDADATLADGVVTTTLPAAQTAVLGSFSTHLAVAQTTSTSLSFKNVCGLIKVTVDAENVTKVVFEGNSGEIVAGAVNVTVADAPTWTPVAEQGATSVTLAPASGTLAKGAYYFSVLPQTFAAGFKVTAYKGEEASVIRNVDAEYTLERADIVGGKAFGIDGEGTEASPYIIKTAQDMVDMRSLAKLGGETWFKMANDIDMAGVTNYIPVNYDQNFERKIHFDGGNYTIDNFHSDFSSYPSLFGVLYGTVKNLKVTNAVINGGGSVSGIIGGYIGTSNKPATVTNVSVQGEVTTTTAERTGGFCGNSVGATFTDCSADVVIVAAKQRVGGFIGRAQTSLTMTNCTAKVNVTTNPVSNYTAGLVGDLNIADAVTDLKNCSVTGSVVGRASCAGLVAATSTGALNLDGCYAECTVSGTTNTGGLVGNWSAGGVMKDCYFKGSVTASGNSGGLVGNNANTSVTISDSYCDADLTFAGNTTGGVIGSTGTASAVNIQRCYYKGTYSTTGTNAGGIIGTTTTPTILNCWTNANMTSTGQVLGGICGTVAGDPVVKNCCALGTVKGLVAVGGIVGLFNNASSVTLQNCVMWSPSVEATKANPTQYASGAIVGNLRTDKTKPNTNIANCWRRADLQFTDYCSLYPDKTTGPETINNVLVDHDDCVGEGVLPPFLVPQGQGYANDWAQMCYHGKAASADATASSVAKSIGWDETIWDLSGATPVLK